MLLTKRHPVQTVLFYRSGSSSQTLYCVQAVDTTLELYRLRLLHATVGIVDPYARTLSLDFTFVHDCFSAFPRPFGLWIEV